MTFIWIIGTCESKDKQTWSRDVHRAWPTKDSSLNTVQRSLFYLIGLSSDRLSTFQHTFLTSYTIHLIEYINTQ